MPFGSSTRRSSPGRVKPSEPALADPGRHVGLADLGAQPPRRLDEHRLAELRAVQVVDTGEAVEVDHEQRAGARWRLAGAAQPLAVGEAGGGYEERRGGKEC